MKKMKKMLALMASVSVMMTSLAIVPVKAETSKPTLLLSEDFSTDIDYENTNYAGTTKGVYTNNGKLVLENESDAKNDNIKYVREFAKQDSGIVAVSYKMAFFKEGKSYSSEILSTNNYPVAEVGTHWKQNKIDLIVHNYSFVAGSSGNLPAYTVSVEDPDTGEITTLKEYDVDMVMDLDNWTVSLYVDGYLNYRGKVGMNTTNGSSTTQFATKVIDTVQFLSPTKDSKMMIDDLKVYHYNNEWTKPVAGKETRVLVHDNFETPEEFPMQEYIFETLHDKAYSGRVAEVRDETTNELLYGAEITDDPTGADNKVLKYIVNYSGSKSIYIAGPRFRMCSGLTIDELDDTLEEKIRLNATSGKVEVSYKFYFDDNCTGEPRVRLFGNSYNKAGTYMYQNRLVPGKSQYLMSSNTYSNIGKGKWHEVRMIIDLDNMKMSRYIDGIVRSEDEDITAKNFAEGLTHIDMTFYAKTLTGSTIYFDDVRVAKLEDVAVASRRLKKAAGSSSATITTVEEFAAQENPNYEVVVYNATEEDVPLVGIMAIYNNGVLERFKRFEIDAAADVKTIENTVTNEEDGTTSTETTYVYGKSTRVETGFSEDADFVAADQAGKTIKLFVWNGTDNITPVTDVITVQ